MGKLRKLIWVTFSGVPGLLLTLAGYNLIELSQNLIKYTGITLLILAVIFWILPDKRREV